MKDEYDHFNIRGSVCRVGPVRRLFGKDPGNQLAARVLRLAVLYEDLRLEAMGVSAKQGSMPRLDTPDHKYRALYFLRRAVGSLVEFEEALTFLQESPQFDQIRASFKNQQASAWDAALSFFKANRSLLKRIRNDVGGHFGNDASTYAANNIDKDFPAKIVIESDEMSKMRAVLHFATAVVAVASLRHCNGDTEEERSAFLMNLISQAADHAGVAVRILIVNHYWPKLG